MKLVVDTNILFSFFWEKSFTKRILTSNRFTLLTPDTAITELKKYAQEIIKKTGLSLQAFEKQMKLLKATIKIIPKKTLSDFIARADEISPDKDDAPFLALCLRENCVLWSNDALLKNQDKINVINTEEIINILQDY